MRPEGRPASCIGCPAYHTAVGFVPPEGPLDADMVVIGHGPDEMSARFSRPLVPTAGPGLEFTNWLNRAGYQRNDCLVTELVWCWLPRKSVNGMPSGQREPTPEEISFCTSRHLWPLLERSGVLTNDARLIVTVGAPATEYLLGVEHSGKYTGTFNQCDLTEHPGYVAYRSQSDGSEDLGREPQRSVQTTG